MKLSLVLPMLCHVLYASSVRIRCNKILLLTVRWGLLILYSGMVLPGILTGLVLFNSLEIKNDMACPPPNLDAQRQLRKEGMI